MEAKPDNDGIRWRTMPNLERGVMIPILKVSPHVAHQVVILDPALTGVDTHFVEGRTKPCTLPLGYCECQSGNYSTRWKGYLMVLQPACGKLAIAELTVNAVRYCPELLQPKTSLIGRWLRLSRRGKNHNSPLIAELQGMAKAMPSIKAPSTADQLKRIWGTKPQESEATDED